MSCLLTSQSLTEILEASDTTPVVILKYSNSCGSSTRLLEELEQAIEQKKITVPTYQVTVQTQPVLSSRIAYVFNVTHESPQILIIKKGTLLYIADHEKINLREVSKKLELFKKFFSDFTHIMHK